MEKLPFHVSISSGYTAPFKTWWNWWGSLCSLYLCRKIIVFGRFSNTVSSQNGDKKKGKRSLLSSINHSNSIPHSTFFFWRTSKKLHFPAGDSNVVTFLPQFMYVQDVCSETFFFFQYLTLFSDLQWSGNILLQSWVSYFCEKGSFSYFRSLYSIYCYGSKR